MHRGYFKHSRKTADWVLRNKPSAYSVWMYLLEMASGTERKTYFNGDEITLEPGQFVTGRDKISKATGVPSTTVERWLKKFEKWSQIGQVKTATSRLITITKWAEYQIGGHEMDNKWTTSGQRVDNDRTLIKKVKEGKRSKFVPPTISEVKSYCKERNNNVDPSRFIDHYTTTGWMYGKNKMKDWKAAVRTWERGNNQKPKQETSAGYHQEAPRFEGERWGGLPDEIKQTMEKIGG